MKRYFILFLLIITLGCDSSTDYKTLKSIQKEFPNSKIEVLKGYRFKFLVKDSEGKIWYIEALNASNEDISYKKEIFQ